MSAPVLGHPEVTVIGTTDPYRMAACLAIFGAQPEPAPALSSAAAKELYGIDAPLEQLIVRTPGAQGAVRLVATPHAAEPFAPLVAGAYGIDYYTTDMELTLRLAAAAGATGFSEVVGYESEGSVDHDKVPDRLQYEARFLAPDEMSVFLTDVSTSAVAFPTVLTREPRRLHSELLMLCWVVEDGDVSRDFWGSEAGLDVVVDVFCGADEMAVLMAHPRSTPLRCVNVADPAKRRRMEFMSYPEETLTRRADWPLRGGLHAAGFPVDDLDRAMAALPSATFGTVITADDGGGARRAVAGKAPDGARFELWERLR
jgi:hypothetical protein